MVLTSLSLYVYIRRDYLAHVRTEGGERCGVPFRGDRVTLDAEKLQELLELVKKVEFLQEQVEELQRKMEAVKRVFSSEPRWPPPLSPPHNYIIDR